MSSVWESVKHVGFVSEQEDISQATPIYSPFTENQHFTQLTLPLKKLEGDGHIYEAWFSNANVITLLFVLPQEQVEKVRLVTSDYECFWEGTPDQMMWIRLPLYALSDCAIGVLVKFSTSPSGDREPFVAYGQDINVSVEKALSAHKGPVMVRVQNMLFSGKEVKLLGNAAV